MSTLPANIKPGTLTAFVYELSNEPGGKSTPASETVERVNKQFPGNKYKRQTILALRSIFGMRDGARATPSNTKSAAPKVKRKLPLKRVKRGPYKTAKKAAAAAAKLTNGTSNGHSEAPARSSDGAAAEFRRLVQRIGTDSARDHLDRLERES